MSTEKKKNILIVDDDPFLQNLYRKTLEREGFNIVTAVDGQDAVEMLPNICADLVVLDLMLPKIHGLKVLETIRADSHLKDLPVLILSNAYLPDTAQKAMQAKATVGMLKSECSPRQLVKIIRETLKLATAESAKSAVETGKQSAGRGSWFSGLLGGKSENSSPADTEARTAESVRTATSKSEATESGASASSVEVQNELLKSWPTDIAMLREIGLKYVKTVGTQESEEHLKNLYRRLRLLAARATIGELAGVSQLSNALEAMLFEHGFNIKRSMSPSVLQTMVQAVDCVEHLFKSGRTTKRQLTRKNRILLVDDDPVCNMANELALKRASFETVCAGDGPAALALLQNKDFDLILLDVNMPEINGFDVCKKIRQLPHYQEVPVIFVTINDDFQSRAQSVLSGSNGLITKPISPLELIVKSLVFLLRAENGNAAAGMSLAGQPGGKGRAVTGDQTKQPAVEPAKNEGRVKELKATQAAVEDRVKVLTQALAAETKRREEAEQQAVANARLQTRLETAKVDNQNADEYFERMLVESKQQAQNSQGNEAWKLEGRNRALESVRNFVQDKVRNLTEVIEVQTKKSEAAKKEVAEYARRKREMEIALAEIQQAKNNLMKEIEAAGNGKLRGDLEAALAKNEKNQAELLQKLESNRQKFELQQQDQNGEPTKTEGRKPDAASEAQVKALNEALVEEKKRCKLAEQQAIEISERRSALEAELVESNRAQDRLRDALAEQQQRLAAQMETQNVELGNIADRTKELTAAKSALADLNDRHANVAGQVQSLTEELVAESSRRTSVERETAELLARRAELEQELAQRTQAQEQLRAELAEKQRLLDEQVQLQKVQLGNVSEQAKELAAARVALAELQARHENAAGQVQTLTESLTVESGRRTTVEQQTAELMARRAELEKDLTQRTQAQEQLRAELAEKQQLLDAQVQTHNVELSTRTQALEGDRATMEAKVKELVQALVAEKERSKNAELQAAGISQQRGTLEMELAESHQVQEQLRAQLAEQEQRLDAQVQTHNVELGNFSSRVQELEAAQMALAELKARHLGATEQVQALNESLAAESNRRATAEQTAAELTARRVELEKELARRTQTQEQLRAELSQQQTRLDSQVQAHNTELGNFNERLHELESTQAALADLKAQHQDVAGQVQALTESLKSESDRRAAAEQTAVELAAQRAKLEQELAQRTRTQEQLRAELSEQQQRLDVQVQTHNVELENFGARVKELESARTALTELETQHADVTGQVRSLTATLAAESSRRVSAEQQSAELAARRTELEQELARRSQTQEELSAELAEKQRRLEAQVAAHNAELGKLTERTKELEAAQAALAELKSRHAAAAEQVKLLVAQAQSLTESLQAESGRRAAVEQAAAKLNARRTELEQELAQRIQTQEQLRAELTEHQQRLAAQVEAHQLEVEKQETRVQELTAVQGTLAELQTRHAGVTEQVRSLTESLKTESGLREDFERQVARLTAQRAELEQGIVQHTQTQKQLRAELAEQQQRLEAQVQAHHVGLENLAERTQELAAVQTALAELQTQHAGVTEQARSLAESLAGESGRRETAEKNLAELQVRRTELEQELSRRTQTQEQLHGELSEKQRRMDAIAAELAEVRRRAEAEAGQLAGQFSQSEQARMELGRQLSDAQELTAAREAAMRSLEGELQKQRGEHDRVDGLFQAETAQRRRLEDQIATVQTELDETSGHLAKLRAAEQVWRGRESELQECIRTQHDEIEKSSAMQAVQAVEIESARTKIADFETHHSALIGQIQELTGQAQTLAESLKTEAGRRGSAEKNLAELLVRRAELEQEVARRAQAQEQLRAQLAGQVQAYAAEAANLAARTQELAATQAEFAELKAQHAGVTAQAQTLAASLTNETSRREVAEKNLAELIVRRTELEQEVVKHSETQMQLRAQLAEQTQARNVEVVNLAARTQELAVTQTALAEWQARHADETSRHAAAEQGWRGRESDLQGRLHSQQDELAKSSVVVAGQEMAIKTTRKELEELRVLQSALCAKIQHLTGEGEAAAKVIQELKAEVVRSESAVENSAKKMAGMRYAILDAARMNARLHREHSHKERQNQDALRRLLSSLAQTPLSLAQRGLLAELQHSVDSLKNSRAGGANLGGYPVELPNFRGSEFSFAEITGSVFQVVRTAATAAGVAVRVSATGTVPHQLIGCAEHVHQLITLLAMSPVTITTGVHALDLQVAIRPKCARFAEISLRVALSTDDDSQELLRRLASITLAAAGLQTASFSEAEISLAAGWQLAAALGAQTMLVMDGGQQVCLLLSLPIEMNSQSMVAPADDAAADAPVVNGNGSRHGHHGRNGQQHNSNGYDLTEARAGAVD